MKNTLKRKPFYDFLDNLYDKGRYNSIKDLLTKFLPKQDEHLKDYLLKYYFDKWRQKANQMKSKENDAALKIQSIYKGHNIRKIFNDDKLRIKIITKIILKLIKASDPNNILQSALAKWMKNAKKLSCHNNARVIQKFCRDVHNKILSLKNKKNLDNYKNLSNILNNIKVSPREFIDKLRQIRRNQILNELLKKLAQKRLDNLKHAFDSIKNYPKYKYLEK